MKELAIKRMLNDETRKQGVFVKNSAGVTDVYSLHITKNGEAIITDNSDYTKIYAVYSLDYWNRHA